jgi:hypothetical protein
MTFTMIAPGPYQVFETLGATYTSDTHGIITGVAQADVSDMINMGCRQQVASTQAAGANGLMPAPLALSHFRNADGSTVAAAAAAGKFGYSITLGTSFGLIGEAANNNTKTDDAIVEFVLPPWYLAGQNLTVTVNAKLTGAGTPGTKTAQIKAYRTASDGTQGADIGPGAASAITAAGADIAFTVTGTTLNPGDRLVFELEAVLQETASSNLDVVIDSVRVS